MVLKTYAITSQTYYDNRLTCYKNILVINNIPVGELKKYVKRLTNIKEALKDCRLYDDEVKCEAQNKCKWGKLEGRTKESCNSK